MKENFQKTLRRADYALNAAYAPPGELGNLLLGQSGSFAGIALSQTYDSRLQPATIQASSGSATVSLAYNFNLGVVDNGNVFYYLQDHLGTSRMMVQSGQTSPCYDADYYPFGGERVYTNTC